MTSRAQILEAGRRGREIREARRQFLRDVQDRNVSLSATLRGEIPHWLRDVHLVKVLDALPYFMKGRIRRVMDDAGAGLAKTVGEATGRQLEIIAADVDKWEAEHPVEALV